MITRKDLAYRLLILAIGLSLAKAAAEPAFCEAEQAYLQQVQGQLKAPPVKEDFSCFRSIEDVDSQNALIVDIRSSLDFEKVRIPGAVNLSEVSLLHTDALKQRPVILVDQGFSRSGLAQLCAKARSKGFTKLNVLLGGLAAWHAAGKPIVGLPQDLERLYQIDTREFLVEAYRNYVSVLAAEEFIPLIRQAIPYQVLLHPLDSQTSPNSQLISFIQQFSESDRYPTVIIGASEQFASSVSRFRSLFVLADSVEYLTTFYRDHQAVLAKRQEVPERYRCRG